MANFVVELSAEMLTAFDKQSSVAIDADQTCCTEN